MTSGLARLARVAKFRKSCGLTEAPMSKRSGQCNPIDVSTTVAIREGAVFKTGFGLVCMGDYDRYVRAKLQFDRPDEMLSLGDALIEAGQRWSDSQDEAEHQEG